MAVRNFHMWYIRNWDEMPFRLNLGFQKLEIKLELEGNIFELNLEGKETYSKSRSNDIK